MRAHAALAVLAAIAGPAVAWPSAALAQAPAMRLEDALRRADRNAYGNRIVDGQADAVAAGVLATWRGVLPAVRAEAGWIRTTDPIGAFGTTLRQRVITQADFDPAGLNHPAPIGNYSGALIVEQPLFNADAFRCVTQATERPASESARRPGTAATAGAPLSRRADRPRARSVSARRRSECRACA